MLLIGGTAVGHRRRAVIGSAAPKARQKSPRRCPAERPREGRGVRRLQMPRPWLGDSRMAPVPTHRPGHTTEAAIAPPNPRRASPWPRKARLPHTHCRARPVQALQVPHRCLGAAPRYRDEPQRGHGGAGGVGTRLVWLWMLDPMRAETQPWACRARGLVGIANTSKIKAE